ncbi:MAG: thermonuclease family protein [Paracoccaceae bacterium]
MGLLTASFVLADAPTGAIRVVDGDTLDVGGTRVRLHGIDAPEASQTCKTEQGRSWACGAWVSREVRDRYDRIVARCAVNGADMGAALVGDGLAFAYRRYAMDYDLVEKQAAVAGRGLWTMQVENPARFRQQGQSSAAAPQQQVAGDCSIKGNISAKGERIYHRPGQEHYDRTRINTAQGERWFCSAAEAERSGWRAAQR